MMFSYNDLAEKFDIYFYRRLLEHLSVSFFPEEIPEQPLHENQQCQHTNGVLQKRSLTLEAVKEPDNEA